jgi:DNA polymerase III subunit delta'
VLNFRSIIGHENIKEHMEKSIEGRSFSHAHIFSGEDGIGKSLVARAAALVMMGKDKDRDYADIIEYRIPKNKKSIGVNEVRELIEEIN